MGEFLPNRLGGSVAGRFVGNVNDAERRCGTLNSQQIVARQNRQVAGDTDILHGTLGKHTEGDVLCETKYCRPRTPALEPIQDQAPAPFKGGKRSCGNQFKRHNVFQVSFPGLVRKT